MGPIYFFMLNYGAMKRLNINQYAALLMVVALLSACSGSGENSATSNDNAPQQTNSNSAGQPQVAQDRPAAAELGTPQPNAVKPASPGSADAASPAPAASNGPAPKLVVSDKKIDFGKQPQEKTLVRAIVVKNGGRAELKIDSVVPS